MAGIELRMPSGGTSRIDVERIDDGLQLTFEREGIGTVDVRLNRELAWDLVDMMLNTLGNELDPRRDPEVEVRNARNAMLVHQGLKEEDEP